MIGVVLIKMLILSKEQMEGADLYCKNKLGLFDEILMENAGQAFLSNLNRKLKVDDKISVLCGRGNNGGDGIVLARRLKQNGFNVRLIFVDGVDNFSKAASYHFSVYCKCGFDYEIFDFSDDSIFDDSDFIVDAIYGIGFHGEPDDEKVKIFEKINFSPAKVVSLDVPSGICADKACFKSAVKADFTFLVSHLKRSLFLLPARLNYGKIYVADAGVVCSPDVAKNCAKTWGMSDFKKTFVFKDSFASKWSSGIALIIGGSDNMIGAVILAAKACLGSGIGLLKLAVPNSLKSSLAVSVLEATYVESVEKNGALADLKISNGFDVVAAGPGLSRSESVANVVEKVVKVQSPIVLDADALSFLNDEVLSLVKNRKFFTVLTPHVKEMARICGCGVEYVKQNRFDLSKQKAAEWNCFIVLKGPNTLITTPSGLQFVNLSGNEGLAKGGTGDVLTGIISAMVAKCSNSSDETEFVTAICNAVFVHGLCSNMLVEEGKDAVAITSTDLLSCLNEVFRKLRMS